MNFIQTHKTSLCSISPSGIIPSLLRKKKGATGLISIVRAAKKIDTTNPIGTWKAIGENLINPDPQIAFIGVLTDYRRYTSLCNPTSQMLGFGVTLPWKNR